MAALDQIQDVDNSANLINASHQGLADATTQQNNWLADQKRALYQQAGGMLANGDYSGGKNALFAGGDLDAGNTVQNWMNTASDRDLAAANRAHALTGEIAKSATSEPLWNQGLDAYDVAGGKTNVLRAIQAKFGWEAARQYALAQHGDTGDALKAQQDKRAAADKSLADTILPISDDEQATVSAIKRHAAVTGRDVSQYLTPDQTGLLPGAKDVILGLGGQGKTVYDADKKAEAAAAKSTKQSQEDAAVKKMQDEFASQNPTAKPLPYTQALSAHNALTSKFASGMVLKGWKLDEQGNATEPVWSAPSGTAAELRARHTTPELQAQLAESKKAGSLAGQQDARASNAVGAMSHIDDAIEDFRSPGAEEAYGYLQANKIWQAVRSEADLKNVNVPSAYRNILQSKGIITQEAAKVFAGNNPQVTDAQRHEAAELLAGLEHAPNVETAVNQLLHLKRALSRIAAQPKPQAFINNPELEKARGAATERFLKDMSSAEEGRSLDPNLRGNTENKAPAPGAKLAPDGNWYLPDPNRPGKFLRVEK